MSAVKRFAEEMVDVVAEALGVDTRTLDDCQMSKAMDAVLLKMSSYALTFIRDRVFSGKRTTGVPELDETLVKGYPPMNPLAEPITGEISSPQANRFIEFPSPEEFAKWKESWELMASMKTYVWFSQGSGFGPKVCIARAPSVDEARKLIKYAYVKKYGRTHAVRGEDWAEEELDPIFAKAPHVMTDNEGIFLTC
jgi:hypothetical protein